MVSTEEFCRVFTQMALDGKTNDEIANTLGLKPQYVAARSSGLRVKVGLPKLKVRNKRAKSVNLEAVRTMVQQMVEENVQN